MLRFPGFDIFGDGELLHFVNGNTATKNNAVKRMTSFVSKDHRRIRAKRKKTRYFMADFGGEVRTVAREFSGAHAEPRGVLPGTRKGSNPAGGRTKVTVLADCGPSSTSRRL